ncbi:armadillo-type protein [Russula earlei]|uniref:Armadillo-type protein n=1 Tax=Russula earlei TaxID=71964 RepID=A0ACC0TY65_9AGAM|nr:armadillo-type protein [Russula earlei]
MDGKNSLANEPSRGGGSASASVNDAVVRHSKYFFDDGNVTFLVDGILFCVHRYLFSRGSEHFSVQFARLEASDYEALPPTISLDDVKCKDFEAFLFVLYSENFGEIDLSYEQWKSVLHLSTLWAFPSLRKWALSYMMPPTPHDQLLLARAYSVRDWVVPALSALCRRRAPLSLDEAIQMDIKDVVLVNTVREDIRHPALQVDVDEIPLRVEAAQARLHADAAEGVVVPPAILQRGAVGQSPLPVVLKQASKKGDSEHGEEPYTFPLPKVYRPEPSDKSRGPDGRQSSTMMYLLGSPRSASVDRNSAGSEFQIGQFSTSAMKMSSEERFLASGRFTSVGGVSLGNSLLAMARPNSPNDTVHDCTPSKHNANESDRATVVGRASPTGLASSDGFSKEPVAQLKASANRWVATSTRRNGLGLYGEQKVRGLLNKLTMVRFDSISDQIITWANKSEREKDGRTLRQVINLVFEAVTDVATLPELYARLCRKMMEQISHNIQDDGIRNAAGEPFAGGQLFREYLVNRCQEDLERGWVDKVTTAVAAATRTTQVTAIKKAKLKTRGEGSDFYSEDSYTMAKAKRRRLGLILVIGELFKLQMLTERIIHSCIKKFLGSPEDEEIENLCKLLTTAGCLLDTQNSRADLDVYFSRMRELTKNKNVNARMTFMLQVSSTTIPSVTSSSSTA